MNFAGQVEAALRAVQFHSPTTYSWLGTVRPVPGPAVKHLAKESRRSWLLAELQAQLYKDFYCHGAPVPAQAAEIEIQSAEMTPFVGELSAANMGGGYRSEGWFVEAFRPDHVIVQKEGLRLWIRPQDCLISPEGDRQSGAVAALPFPKELLSVSPGFYVACGDNELVLTQSDVLVRIYWNVTAEGALRLMRRATSDLNGAAVPFKIKALNDPARFTRCDAVVLYVRKVDYPRVSALLGAVYPDIADSLKNAVPAFTKRLAKGIALAEDPGQGNSFGSHRCRILAEGLLHAYEQRKTAIEERLEIVRRGFEDNGIKWDAPFLTSSTVDDYGFQAPAPIRKGARAGAECTPQAFLEAAAKIGQRLEHEAVWCDGRCNWIGAVEDWVRSPRSRSVKRYGALGPELYSGTSGIALFLAELHSATGLAGIRRCSLGAMYQALSRLDGFEAESRWGLYTGWVGIALAAALVGRLLREDDLLEHSIQILRKLEYLSAHETEPEFDLISGKAGAIAGLIMLRELLAEESCLELAVKFGDELLQSSENVDYGRSWRSSSFPHQQNLTGFAHGTAGAAFALIELFRLTSDARYREAAERAFDYERHWFDREAGNWPDFREVLARRGRGAHPFRFSSAWCHGAPGIALSRLRAFQVLKDTKYKAEAVIALETTCRIATAWLNSETTSDCLCHGLFGNAQILHYGGQVLGNDFAHGLVAAQAIANARITTIAELPQAPGLMLGMAGIGYFYLRMYDHAVPSALSPARAPTLPSA